MKNEKILITILSFFLIIFLYRLPKVVIQNKKLVSFNLNLIEKFFTINNMNINKFDKIIYNFWCKKFYVKKKIKYASFLSFLFIKYNFLNSLLKYLGLIINYIPSYRSYMIIGNNLYNNFSFKSCNNLKILKVNINQSYNKVLLKYFDNLNIQSKMSIIFSNQNPMKGVIILKKILKHTFLHKLSLINIGILSLKSGQYKKAIKRFKNLLKKYPFNLKARIYLAISYIAINKKSLAVKNLIFVKNNCNFLVKLSINNYLNSLK